LSKDFFLLLSESAAAAHLLSPGRWLKFLKIGPSLVFKTELAYVLLDRPNVIELLALQAIL
jgi:hypothetical protein